MTPSISSTRIALYALFTLSGFAGLIYESIWSHYLKLFLGHAAYAQTLVLMIFMGGMAIGAWIAGERATRIQRPLLAYAVVEGVLGVAALVFDPAFRGLQGWTFETLIPSLQATPVAIDLAKWLLSALVILPQSILLGATFPLMSAGILRVSEGASGRVLATLYFTNSLGAAVGVLVSGFVLVDAVGLPGTILTAGLINFLLVLGVWLASRELPVAAPVAMRAPEPGIASGLRLLLAVSFLTGAASFFYEIGWIRMLSLVLGAATHSFELMLSAFILGLALGSAFIRKRIATLHSPTAALGVIQVAMALLALGTVLVYPLAFDAMAGILRAVGRNDEGYLLYMLLSHGICLGLMLPVTLCAGMTLPLITHLLIERGQGERAIGRVYAANTLGAITGVMLAVHFVMPLFGVRQVVIVGALVDLGLGLWLLSIAPAARPGPRRLGLAVSLAIAAGVTVAAPFDPQRLASGVYRTAEARLDVPVHFYRDGKTVSVAVYGPEEWRSITSNGKVDASLYRDGRASPDDSTMILAAVLPAMMLEAPQSAAAIGFGSGRTTHALLHDRRLAQVDTIEIEAAMVEGARQFGPAVAAAYDDPRSQVHIEDAKTFFARGGQRYDLIISEPSNPWVSGVASLFSREFYVQAKRHLKPGGLFVQWLQLYETDISIVGSVMKALGSEFEDYVLYSVAGSDLLIVASPTGPVPRLQWRDAVVADLGRLMNEVSIRSPADLAALRIGDRRELEPLFRAQPLPANSDYFPVVDQNAARLRFLNREALGVVRSRRITARLEAPWPSGVTVTATPATAERAHAQALAAHYLRGAAAGDAGVAGSVLVLNALGQACGSAPLETAWLAQFRHVVPSLVPYVGPADGSALAARLRRACPRGGQAVRDWIGLLEASASRVPAARTLALRLLEQEGEASPSAEFLLQEALLVTLREGDVAPEVAQQWAPGLWTRGEREPALTLLMAHLAPRAASRP